jgi:hypothetical protein
MVLEPRGVALWTYDIPTDLLDMLLTEWDRRLKQHTLPPYSSSK